MGFSDWAKERLNAALPKCYVVANSDARPAGEKTLWGFFFLSGKVGASGFCCRAQAPGMVGSCCVVALLR